MIHTAELIKEISEEEYKYILSLVEKFEYRNNKAHIYALAEYGITDIEINRYVAQNSPTITYYNTGIVHQDLGALSCLRVFKGTITD